MFTLLQPASPSSMNQANRYRKCGNYGNPEYCSGKSDYVPRNGCGKVFSCVPVPDAAPSVSGAASRGNRIGSRHRAIKGTKQCPHFQSMPKNSNTTSSDLAK